MFTARHADAQTECCFENLEARILLVYSDFPSIGSLDDAMNHTVVRLETTLGAIDLELLDDDAPGTVENFLRYVTEQLYDNTFFHRSINSPNPFVVQGGGFSVDSTGDVSEVPEFGTIDNEFDPSRSNVLGTVAMAKLGGDPDSATSQFFFNLNDNSSNLDNQNGGFTVFANIVQGLDVAQDINALMTEDFIDPQDPETGALSDVPVVAAAVEISPSVVVQILDAEIIKPAGIDEYYDDAIYYPEGFRGPTIVESIELFNSNEGSAETAFYQVILRYESGVRDQILASGELDPNTSTVIQVSDFNLNLDLVRDGEPFAFEIQTAIQGATNPPVTAQLHHTDFGGTVGEAFVSVRDQSPSDIRTWDFPFVEIGPNSKPFLVWQSLSGEDTAVTTTFFPEGGATPTQVAEGLDAFRRGGINIADELGLTPGRYSVRVTAADQPIVAALSSYTVGVPDGDPTPAYGMIGVQNGGDTRGALAGLVVPQDGTGLISVLNTSETTAAVVRIDLIDSDNNSQIIAPLVIAPLGREDFDLTTLVDFNDPAAGTVAPGEFFAIRYSSTTGAAPVAVSYMGTNGSLGYASPVSTIGGAQVHFANGVSDPNRFGDPTMVETISVFNPRSAFGASGSFEFTIDFYFNDGTVISTTEMTLVRQGRVDVNIADLTDVTTKIASGSAFENYSFTVRHESISPLIAQYTRIDTQTGEALTTEGTIILGITPLSDASLLGGIS